MMDLKGFWMRVNTRAPPAPPKQLSSTTSDSIDARGECGGAEFVCAWRAHLRLNYVAVAPYLITTNRNRRRIARDARKKQQCKHNKRRDKCEECSGSRANKCEVCGKRKDNCRRDGCKPAG